MSNRGAICWFRANTWALALLLIACLELFGAGCRSWIDRSSTEETDNQLVHEFLRSKGLLLPSTVRGNLIRPTGSNDLSEASFLLHHTSPVTSASERRRLIVLAHGWGGDKLDTWAKGPQFLLDVNGIPYDLLLYSYPTGFYAGTGLKDAGERFLTTLITVVAGGGGAWPAFDEIYVIGHSMGGLLIQWALVRAIHGLDQPDPSIYQDLLNRVKAIVLIAVPNGRLERIIQTIGKLFDVDVEDIGPYSLFRDELERFWQAVEKARREEFRRIFRERAILIKANMDNVVDNKTITDRFESLTPTPLLGTHTSIVKINSRSDELYVTLASFLQRKRPSGKGPEIRPTRLNFVEKKVYESSLEIKNHDQVPIHWQVKDKPDGYAVNPEFGKHLQQDRSETVRIVRVYKDLSSPESKFGIEWWYDTGPSTKSEVVVTLYSSPDAPRAYRDTLSSIKLAGRPDLIELPLDVKQNVSPSGQAYFKTQVLRAAGFYKEAIPQIEFARGVNPDLDKSSDFTRVAGMTYLRINQPAEAIKYFERLSELDPTSSIYLAATLVGLGKASAAHAVTKQTKVPLSVAEDAVDEISKAFPPATFTELGYHFSRSVSAAPRTRRLLASDIHAVFPFKAEQVLVDRKMITDLRSIADKLKAWLGEHPTGKVLLEGFARDDEPGRNLQYEQAIAFRRAQIVRDHLVLFGVPAHRISIISFREEIPRWALNPDVINGVSLFAIRE